MIRDLFAGFFRIALPQTKKSQLRPDTFSKYMEHFSPSMEAGGDRAPHGDLIIDGKKVDDTHGGIWAPSFVTPLDGKVHDQ
jgi:hypothetical protein